MGLAGAAGAAVAGALSMPLGLGAATGASAWSVKKVNEMMGQRCGCTLFCCAHPRTNRDVRVCKPRFRGREGIPGAAVNDTFTDGGVEHEGCNAKWYPKAGWRAEGPEYKCGYCSQRHSNWVASGEPDFKVYQGIETVDFRRVTPAHSRLYSAAVWLSRLQFDLWFNYFIPGLFDGFLREFCLHEDGTPVDHDTEFCSRQNDRGACERNDAENEWIAAEDEFIGFVDDLHREAGLGQEALNRFWERRQDAPPQPHDLDLALGHHFLSMDDDGVARGWDEFWSGAVVIAGPDPGAVVPAGPVAVRHRIPLPTISDEERTPNIAPKGSPECVMCGVLPPDRNFVHGDTSHALVCAECTEIFFRTEERADRQAKCPMDTKVIEKVLRHSETKKCGNCNQRPPTHAFVHGEVSHAVCCSECVGQFRERLQANKRNPCPYPSCNVQIEEIIKCWGP